MRALPLAPLALLVALAVNVAACSGVRISCGDDDDCPDDLPACVAGFCAEGAGDDDGDGEEGEGEGAEGEGEGAEGEGEGEGEAACVVDGDCGDGLCWTDATPAELTGACLPGAGDAVACAATTASRDDGGPAFAVLSLAPGAVCTPGPEVAYTARVAWRDADGDVSGSGFALRVTAPGGPFGTYNVQWDSSFDVEGRGDTGVATFVFCAFAGVDQLALQLFDDDEDGSNVVCAAP